MGLFEERLKLRAHSYHRVPDLQLPLQISAVEMDIILPFDSRPPTQPQNNNGDDLAEYFDRYVRLDFTFMLYEDSKSPRVDYS